MRNHVLVTSLRTALLALPLMAACGGNSAGGGVIVPPGGLTLPDCAQGQLISVGADRTLGCTQALTTSLSPPSCPAGTHALNATDGTLVCAAKGNGTTNTDLRAAIDNVSQKTTNLVNQVASFGGGGGSAKFCGLSPVQSANGAALSDGGADGIPAATSICGKVAACGTGAHMCSVFEMYESAASGVLNNNMDVALSWVYSASWSQEFSDPAQSQAGSGQSDNCGSFTYPTADRKWYGTAVEWKVSGTGKKALLFHSGPGSTFTPTSTTANTAATNTFAVPCSSKLPIACCK